MDIRFDGKRALVTGAGKGIGKSLTLKLVELGADVVAVSRTQSDLDALKKVNPKKTETICLDIGDWEATELALKGIGPVDLLINNAGILDVAEFGSISKESVDSTLDINLKSVINITQIVTNGMKSNGKGGAIVNVSSVSGMYAFLNYHVYCASKGGLDQLTRTMAAEFGPHKIRVNSVNPTIVRTPMSFKVGAYDDSNENSKLMLNRTPLRRFAEPEDIVGPILFLLSDYAAMVTGIVFPIDGGLGICYN